MRVRITSDGGVVNSVTDAATGEPVPGVRRAEIVVTPTRATAVLHVFAAVDVTAEARLAPASPDPPADPVERAARRVVDLLLAELRADPDLRRALLPPDRQET